MSDVAIQEPTPLEDLKTRWNALKQKEPMARARDVAQTLGTSEAGLVAMRVGNGVTALDQDFKGLLESMPAIGRVMVLTRNQHAVHERHGVFGNIHLSDRGGVVLNESIDLRLFLRNWAYGFAVEETVRSGQRTSLQFFDKSGEAVHKVYLVPESNQAEFDLLLARHGVDRGPWLLETVAPEPPKTDLEDDRIDKAAFLDAWENLQDVHDFHDMLKDHEVARHQAMRLALGRFTEHLGRDALNDVLARAAAREVSIMVFVGNRGCIQIHTGQVSEIVRHGPWLNVLDPEFNLHVKEDSISDSFIVRKPTRDGIVTALEVYDADRQLILSVFGERKPGKPELETWRKLIAGLGNSGELD